MTVFTSFGDMLGDVLGFNEKTTKSKVGEYFKKVKETVEGVKSKLNTMVENMKSEGNPNYSVTESEVNKFIKEKLDKIVEGANEVIKGVGGDNEPIANVAAPNGGAGAVAEGASVKSLSEGIGKIVGVVLEGKGNHEAGTDKKATDGNAARTNGAAQDGEAGKLFNTTNAGTASGNNAKKAAADASKAVGAVTGADILQAIIKNGDSAKLAKEATGTTTASPKDATIAGAIALRAMSKGGKFSNASDADAQNDVATAVKGAAVSAVTKALDTLTIAIRKTIDEGLKEVKKAMNIIANDHPLTSETGVTK